MAPRFSILLPTWDRPQTIGFAIRAVLAQTDPDFELLVVCDGCRAPTADVVRGFDDERIRWFGLPKAPGFGWANRNIALRAARGELVAFGGDDDLWLPDHLEKVGAAFADGRVEWAYSRPLWMSDHGIAVPFAVDLRRPDAFERFMHEGNRIPPSCIVHRRDCLERYGDWPEDLPADVAGRGVDWELWKRMLRPSNGANLAYVAEPTAITFRADWRPGDRWGPPPLPAWMRVATSGWWPDALRVPIGQGQAPQAAVWDRLESEGSDWVPALREAVTSVIDGFAWNASAETPGLIREVAAGARQLLEAGDAARALALATTGLRIDPTSIDLETIAGRASRALGDSETAEASFRRALALDARATTAAIGLSDILRARGELGEALALARRAAEARPGAEQLERRIGELVSQLGTDADPPGPA